MSNHIVHTNQIYLHKWCTKRQRNGLLRKSGTNNFLDNAQRYEGVKNIPSNGWYRIIPDIHRGTYNGKDSGYNHP